MHCDDVIIVSSPQRLYDGGMRGQQRHLLLWRFERGQGPTCSHTWHDSAVGWDGTIIVQGGYSLILDDLGVFPPWEKPLVCSSFMRVFGTGHVKEWIYELAGAYLHRPTALLSCRNLLMECSQDHFIVGALDGHK